MLIELFSLCLYSCSLVGVADEPLKTDGSEDGCIHCIKPDGVAAGAARDVSEGTVKLNAAGNRGRLWLRLLRKQ